MAEYKSYINALKQCAKEHESELVSFAHIRTTDLCNDTANLLEKLETESDNSIVIPEGATNGDMFKAVFGYEPATDAVVCNKEDWCGASEPCNYCTSNPDKIGKEEDWWDKPYKKEAEK